MGRKRSDYLCPKCGKTGSPAKDPTSYDTNGNPRQRYRYVRHFENGERSKCYVEDILRKQEEEDILKDKSISDDRLCELLENTNDAIPIIANYRLTRQQRQKLSLEGKREYFDCRSKIIKNIRDQRQLRLAKLTFNKDRKEDGIQTVEESEKRSTILPPKETWGPSETGRLLSEEADRSFIISKMHKSMANDLRKLEEELIRKGDMKKLQSLRSMLNVNRWIQELLLVGGRMIYVILKYITDEKSGETLLGWLRIAIDRYEFGIHAAASRNPILTGKYIMRLGKSKDHKIINGWYPKTVEIVPIKREFTSKQVRQKTNVPSKLSNDAIDIIKGHEATKILVSLYNNKKNLFDIAHGVPIKEIKIPEVYQGLRPADLFKRARDILLENHLSNAMELVTNAPIEYVKIVKVPNDFYKEQIKKGFNKLVNQEDIDNLKVIEVAPENIKDEDIYPGTLHKFTYSVKQGRAGRRHNLTERLSEHA